MKKHKNKIIAGVVIAMAMAFIFWYGGDAPGLRGWTSQSESNGNIVTEDLPFETELPTVTDKPTEMPLSAETVKEETPVKQAVEVENRENKPQNTPMMPVETECISEENSAFEVQSGSEAYSEANGMVINESTGKDKYLTEPVPEGKPLPVEPQDAVVSDKELTCTLSVRCDTILNNISWLDKDKACIVPKDGVIFSETTVTFYEGESVFNLLMREMKKNRIHMEFENTPIYNSAYIEGIANLYEFDCGELSGWMYKVNDWFPNYGCSRYQLKEGDRVEWVYTCDLGADVGGYYAANGGQK